MSREAKDRIPLRNRTPLFDEFLEHFFYFFKFFLYRIVAE